MAHINLLHFSLGSERLDSCTARRMAMNTACCGWVQSGIEVSDTSCLSEVAIFKPPPQNNLEFIEPSSALPKLSLASTNKVQENRKSTIYTCKPREPLVKFLHSSSAALISTRSLSSFRLGSPILNGYPMPAGESTSSHPSFGWRPTNKSSARQAKLREPPSTTSQYDPLLRQRVQIQSAQPPSRHETPGAVAFTPDPSTIQIYD